jgi:hypothetical protein
MDNNMSLAIPCFNPLASALERLRVTTRMKEADWCDLLEIHWRDFQRFKAGYAEISERSLENLSRHFDLDIEDVRKGKIDFSAVAMKLEGDRTSLPERYQKAAFGRRRSSITSVQYLEDKISWRLKSDVIQKFGIPESQLKDPFSKISVLFMMDLCNFLGRRGFQSKDFLAMGSYNFETSVDSLIGLHFSQLRSTAEIFESFFSDFISMFESNCTYKLSKLTSRSAKLEIWSNSDVAAELNIRHIGNAHLCSFKAGHASSLPRYLGLPNAEVREVACVHKGDPCCRFEFTFEEKAKH